MKKKNKLKTQERKIETIKITKDFYKSFFHILNLGGNMRIIDDIKTFLYDKKYFISMYEDNIYIFNYLDLVKLSEEEIILKMEEFNLSIKGVKLHVTKMLEQEININGTINDVRLKR